MPNLKKHTQIALAYFLIVGLLGVFLRFFFVTSIPANFRYVVHAHSHIALLGWVYISLSTLIYRMYFWETGENAKTYKRIFWFTQVTIIGMLCTFPFTGYALFSITFSTLFLLASYWFAWFVLKRTPLSHRSSFSYRCIKAALWYLIISSIGPWAIGGVMATLGNTSIWYKLSIYFYLHFQYNGWFILALCGIFIYLLEKNNFTAQKRDFNRFFYLLNAGIILSLFLSGLWVNPPVLVYVMGLLGAVLQLLGFMEFFSMIKESWKEKLSLFSSFQKSLLKIAWAILIIKILLQLFTAIPYFAELSFFYTDFVIGYLHLTFLGVISISLFAFLENLGLLRLPKWLFFMYFTGFALSEVLIFYKGTALWLGLPFFVDYFWILTATSSLIPLSVGILLVQNILKPARSSAK